jgi:peptide subunit release factor RF-3
MDMYEKAQRQEFIAAAQTLYDKLKAELEPAHEGEIVAIKPDNGEYFLGGTLNQADEKAYAEYPDAWMYFVRIGAPEASLPLKTW